MRTTIINKTYIFLSFFIIANLVLAQHRKENKKSASKQPIYFEAHVFPYDTLYQCFVSYKIPFNNLLFVKDNDEFISGVSISFELSSGHGKTKRIFDSKSVSSASYQETLSKKKYLVGVKSFNLLKGNYVLSPNIALANTDVEFRVSPIKIKAQDNDIGSPIVVLSNLGCDSLGYILANTQNFVPFSRESYSLLVPLYKNNISNIKVKIEQKGRMISEFELDNSPSLAKEIVSCKDNIMIPKGGDNKFFIVDGINRKLDEGRAEITVISDSVLNSFPLNVFWEDKPKSLMNIEKAIESLRLIGLDNAADSLGDLSEEVAYQGLIEFWKKFDDEPSTSYNEVLNEFYTRIDYIRENFNSLNKDDGLENDRGKTYLIYGAPSKIERKYSDAYNILEVWYYDSIGEKIYFSDKTGTGNFIRIK